MKNDYLFIFLGFYFSVSLGAMIVWFASFYFSVNLMKSIVLLFFSIIWESSRKSFSKSADSLLAYYLRFWIKSLALSLLTFKLTAYENLAQKCEL